ncbi:MAG: hypothetical protein ACXWC9_10830 [Pseudobdellovibrionaceae bacterium]
MKTKIILSLFSLLFLVNCSSLATKVRDEASLKQVRKVAVVAYRVTLPKSKQLSLNLGSGNTGSDAGGSILTGQSPETDQILTNLMKEMAKNQKWAVMDINKVKMAPGYKKAFDQTMNGWQNKMPANPGTQQYVVNEVMDTDAPRILRPEGRDQLISDLGVDAIISLNVTVYLEGTTVMGIGNRYPQSLVTLNVYKKGQENPIWFESAKGDVSTESVGKTGFIDEKKLARLAVSSAQSAYSKMGNVQ